MPGEKKFSIYKNGEYQTEIVAKNHSEATQEFAKQNGIEGEWSMGSSRFVTADGEFITAKMSF